MNVGRLVRYRALRGRVRVITGLRIGGAAENIEIGGMDNPIIRDPATNMPYIPGSSIKGKMRGLLELRHGYVDEGDGASRRPGGGPFRYDGSDNFIVRAFGASAGEHTEYGPTRLAVRDAMLTPDSVAKLKAMGARGGSLYAEVKYENTINRWTGTALNPRPVERVPPGTEFDFELTYRVFEMEDNGATDERNFQYILEGLALIQLDALGASGSRGYGKVEFVDLVDENGAAVELPTIEELQAATV